jgi:GntR family transcriptional regulator
MITFRLDTHSGLAPYLQIVQQVKQALRLGQLQPGDQMPTVREVVVSLAINPNTVMKAYRELEHEGLLVSRPGIGIFVQRALGTISPENLAQLRRGLVRWVQSARAARLDDEDIQAIFVSVLHSSSEEEKPA